MYMYKYIYICINEFVHPTCLVPNLKMNNTGRKPPPNESKKRKPTPPAVQKRKTKFTEANLSPTRGSLNCRLDNTLHHFPTPHRPEVNRRNYACQLHRLANGALNKEKKNTHPTGGRLNVFTCEACNVNLCVACWKIYHTVPRLESKYCQIIGK